MEPFLCISLSIWLISKAIKKNAVNRPAARREPPKKVDLFADWGDDDEVEMKESITKAQREEEKQKQKEIAELKKQGYTDELIAVILPQINNK